MVWQQRHRIIRLASQTLSQWLHVYNQPRIASLVGGGLYDGSLAPGPLPVECFVLEASVLHADSGYACLKSPTTESMKSV